MAKEVSKVVKLQVRGGAANPSPPVGPALGAAGVNIMEFCKQFNGRTQDKQGKVLPVAITVYSDNNGSSKNKKGFRRTKQKESSKCILGPGKSNCRR